MMPRPREERIVTPHVVLAAVAVVIAGIVLSQPEGWLGDWLNSWGWGR